MRPRLFALMLFLAGLAAAAARAEVVTVYTNASFAPLMIDGKRGLYPELVDYLNRRKLGELSFKLAYLPRKRLQVKLEEGSLDGIVIGMMPTWFNDAAQTRYLWTEPFAADNFVLVSNKRKPVNPALPATLPGATIGLTLGYVYPGIDEWIDRHGLVRSGAVDEQRNIAKLLLDRTDCIVVSETVIRYYAKTHGMQDKFAFSQLPGQLTERRFLIPPAYRHVHALLAPAVRQLASDPAWQHIARQY